MGDVLTRLFFGGDGTADQAKETGPTGGGRSDWRRAYLPGCLTGRFQSWR